MTRKPVVKDIEAELEAEILSRFDPEQLAQAGLESVFRRQVIKEALKRNDVHWNFVPNPDVSQQYVR